MLPLLELLRDGAATEKKIVVGVAEAVDRSYGNFA
jgi:hypothetical protein